MVPYDPLWQQVYIGEAIRLSSALGELLASVHHVGGTAVPAMCARPVIDILVEVRDIGAVDSYSPAMRGYGYSPSGEAVGEGRRLFYREDDEGTRTHVILVFQQGDPEVRRQVLFRDYLAGHPEDAEAYCGLKEELARRFPGDPESYDLGKREFISRIEEKLGT